MGKVCKEGKKKGLHNNGNIYCIPGPHMYPITGACSVMRWCGTQNPECALTICCSHGRPTCTRALNTQQPLCVWDGWLLPTFLHQFETGGLNSMICFPCTHFSSRLGCCFSHLDLYILIYRRQTSIGITSADVGHQTKKIALASSQLIIPRAVCCWHAGVFYIRSIMFGKRKKLITWGVSSNELSIQNTW